MQKQYDIVVVGAGPIGAYTAYQLADKGFNVCLLDKKKKIGEGIICAGIISKEAFKRYDLPSESILSRIDSVSFISPFGQRLEYEGPDIFAYIVSRKIFDSGLLKLAKRVGAEVNMGQKAVDIKELRDSYKVVCSKNNYYAKAVVIATGINYELLNKLRMGTPPQFIYGSQIEMPISFSQSNIQIHLGQTFVPGSFGWVIPAGDNTSRIGVLVQNRGKVWLKKMLEQRLHFSVKNINDEELKIKPIAYGPIKHCVKGNILAVGEAAGQVKTTTGGGIFYGLLCSEIAVHKLTQVLKNRGDLHDYEIAWRSALISELDIGKHLRNIAVKLSDREIETLFSFVKKNRFWVELLVSRINFDYHSNLIYFCLKSFGAFLKLPET